MERRDREPGSSARSVPGDLPYFTGAAGLPTFYTKGKDVPFDPLTDWDGTPLGAVTSWAELQESIATAADEVRDKRTEEAPTPLLSPGYIGLGYGNAQVRHKTRIRLTVVADPNNIGQMTTAADSWAEGLSWGISNEETVDTFYVYGPDGALLYQTLLPTARVGHITNHQLQANSFTWTLTGHGVALVGALRPGEARTRIFTYSWYEHPARGTKNYPLSNLASPMLPCAQALATNSLIWADFYGNKAGMRGFAPIQLNASAQKREGW